MVGLLRRTLPVLVLLTATFLATAAMFAMSVRAPEVVVHEWGTFTTVAGEDGQAINWLPLGGPSDLPCFVEHYLNRHVKFIGNAEQEGPIDYAIARSALVGTVRMETPVLYFYSPEDAVVSVNVRFPRGLMTEWFPKAVVNQPSVMPAVLDNPNLVGGISWPAVEIHPGRVGEYPQGSGTEPLLRRARDRRRARLGQRAVREVPLLSRRRQFPCGAVGCARQRRKRAGDQSRVPADPSGHSVREPRRRDDVSSRRRARGRRRSRCRKTPASFDSLRAELVTMLEKTGLFRKEAEAMVETWSDSWFEEGTRVFYLVPPASVDEILPLSISPAPAAVARAFVGRMEMITPDALVRAQAALAAGDDATLEKMGRFLGPIADRLVARTSSVSERNKIRAITNTVFAAYVKRMSGCQ